MRGRLLHSSKSLASVPRKESMTYFRLVMWRNLYIVMAVDLIDVLISVLILMPMPLVFSMNNLYPIIFIFWFLGFVFCNCMHVHFLTSFTFSYLFFRLYTIMHILKTLMLRSLELKLVRSWRRLKLVSCLHLG